MDAGLRRPEENKLKWKHGQNQSFPENHVYLEQRKWVKKTLHKPDFGFVLPVFIPVTEIHQGSFKTKLQVWFLHLDAVADVSLAANPPALFGLSHRGNQR